MPYVSVRLRLRLLVLLRWRLTSPLNGQQLRFLLGIGSDTTPTASATAGTFLMRTPIGFTSAMVTLTTPRARRWVRVFHRHYWMLRVMQINGGGVCTLSVKDIGERPQRSCPVYSSSALVGPIIRLAVSLVCDQTKVANLM